jgi:putative membrane protein
MHTFAQHAYDPEETSHRKKSMLKVAGEYLGIPFAKSDPREMINRSKMPVGNLPLEILNYLSAYTQISIRNGTLNLGLAQSQISK